MLTKVIEDYKIIQSNVDLLIKESGYRMSFIYEKLGMDKTSFYLKRKHANFSVDEIERLLVIIRADELEDRVLLEMSLEDQELGVMSEDEKREWLNAS